MENIPQKLYHCTERKNLTNIMNEGIKKGYDGVVYLADSANNSAKFLVVRGIKIENLIAFEIDTKKLNAKKLGFSYDHNENFFGCKAYMYADDIKISKLLNVIEFE
jgi:RNA:NAD 2'-phosphotransferase (TPT1/KptA family)